MLMLGLFAKYISTIANLLKRAYLRNHNGSTITRIDDLLLVSFRKVLLLNRGLEVEIERRLNLWGMLKVMILQEMGC